MSGPPIDERLNAGEFFATGMMPVEVAPDFVRLVFLTDRQAVSIVLTPMAFAEVVRTLMAFGEHMLN